MTYVVVVHPDVYKRLQNLKENKMENNTPESVNDMVIEAKIRAMKSNLRMEVEQFIKEGADVVAAIKTTHEGLSDIFKKQPELIDDTISVLVLDEVGEHLPWYTPAFVVRTVISKVVAAILKKQAAKEAAAK